VDIIRTAYYIRRLELMILIFAVLYVSLTMALHVVSFYSASALLAMRSAVLARGFRLSDTFRYLSRQMKIRSWGFQHLVGQSL